MILLAQMRVLENWQFGKDTAQNIFSNYLLEFF